MPAREHARAGNTLTQVPQLPARPPPTAGTTTAHPSTPAHPTNLPALPQRSLVGHPASRWVGPPTLPGTPVSPARGIPPCPACLGLCQLPSAPSSRPCASKQPCETSVARARARAASHLEGTLRGPTSACLDRWRTPNPPGWPSCTRMILRARERARALWLPKSQG